MARVAPGPSKERVKAGAGGCAGGGRGGQVLRWELGSGGEGTECDVAERCPGVTGGY